MAHDVVFQRLVEILAEFVKDPKVLEKVNGGTRIVEDLGVNSARLIDIVLVVEDEYDIELDDDTLNAMRTIDDAVKAIVLEQESDGE